MSRSARSFGDTGAEFASLRTWSTSSIPSGNWAAAKAACEEAQKSHSFNDET
jgi:hypothetical protein